MFEILAKQGQPVNVAEVKSEFDSSPAKKGKVVKDPFHLNKVFSWGIPGRLDMSGATSREPVVLTLCMSVLLLCACGADLVWRWQDSTPHALLRPELLTTRGHKTLDARSGTGQCR